MQSTNESNQSKAQPERKKKECIINLNKYLEKRIRVKFTGGRECVGLLKGCDNLQNIVLDNTIEYLRDPEDPRRITDNSRELGLVVCRGPTIEMFCPDEGMEQTANPFLGVE